MFPVSKTRLTRLAPLACALVALWAAPGVAAAAGSPVTEAGPTAADGGPLSPELSTLATPALAEAPAAQQAAAIDMPVEGPGSLVREGDQVVVEAHFDQGAVAQVEALEAAGATVLATSRRYQTVALAVAPADLEALAEVPGLAVVEPSRAPVFYGAEGVDTAASTSNGLCEGGSVISQGLTQLNVAAARGAFGARGVGQTIGVLSDSFNTATTAIGGGTLATHAHEDETGNDLPGPASTCSGQQVPVNVIAEGPAEETDEGRAMLQVIHDLAPQAELAFATAYSTELQFARNIERLAEPVSAGGAGADVIVDDVSYFAEPFFQDGPVAVAIRKVTEAGVTYLTAAGNDNLIESGTGNEIASWERSEFRDAACPIAIASGVGEAASSCMNFSPSGTDTTFGITVEGKSTLIVDLQWAEAWYGVGADLNAYLLDSAGNVIVAEPVKNVGSGALREPVELLNWENKSSSKAEVQLVIDRCIHNCNWAANVNRKPRLKFDLLENGAGVSKTEYPRSEESAGIVVGPTIYGHAASAAAITLAAANYGQSATAPAEPERYSSRGPATHYFGPVDGTTAAAALATPEVLEKPNVTATDCASTTFFATHRPDGWHFCGTSEAAPHAAAIAALMEQTEPLASPGAIVAAMESSARPFTTVKERAAVGAGLLNAEAAIIALGGRAVEDPASSVIGAVAEPMPKAGEGSTAGNGNGSTAPGPASEPAAPAAPAAKKALRTRIVGHPKALERTRKATIVGRFRLWSNEEGTTFYCQVDGGPRRACGERFQRRFGPGRHVLTVSAVSAAGDAGEAPSVFRFRVQRIGR
jgi:Subtilase family